MWIVLHLNVEPWRLGPITVVRTKGRAFPKVGEDPQLASYKEAVRTGVLDHLAAIGMTVEEAMISGPVDLRMWFWRRMDAYTSPQARTVRKHEIDATNAQKGTEDALHGIFFKNDKNDLHVESTMVVQDHVVEPCLVLSIEPYVEDLSMIPPLILEQVSTPPDTTPALPAQVQLPQDSEFF